MIDEDRSPLERAKSVLGGAAGLAARVSERDPGRGLTPQAVSQWKRVPVDRVRAVSALTGIPRQELRPDIFGDEDLPP